MRSGTHENDELSGPEVEVTVAGGGKVRVSGSMLGHSGLILEYMAEGGEWHIAGSTTVLPGTFTVPGGRGRVRAIFTKRNEPVGNYSREYPIEI